MIHLLLTLESDLVLSARPGSTGQHECLDFIPGSALWGAAASRFYGRWAAQSEWEKVRAVFHSGRVRFGCGFLAPLKTHPALPIPHSWYYPKKIESPSINSSLLASVIHNLAAAERWNFQQNGQPKQMRDGWFDPCKGKSFRTDKNHRLKTAIDGGNFDAPRESQLFGYTSIQTGQSFIATIQAEADTPGWEEVERYFSTLTHLHLGRSRTAEFGRVSVKRLSETESLFPTSHGAPDDGITRLHLLSDLALADAHGQPLLWPTSEALGLGEGEVIPAKTHLRFRTYSPWNRFRGCSDSERQVICAGGVISLRCQTPLTDHLRHAGLYQAEGLGMLAVNPSYLVTAQPKFSPTSLPAVPNETPTPAPSGVLYEVMMRRYMESTIERLAVAIGTAWAKEWKTNCAHVSKSQWARIREAAVSAADTGKLQVALNEIFSHGLSAERQWNKPRRLGVPTPASLVNGKIQDRQSLEKTLNEEHLGREGWDLLARQATREAAISMARMKGPEK